MIDTRHLVRVMQSFPPSYEGHSFRPPLSAHTRCCLYCCTRFALYREHTNSFSQGFTQAHMCWLRHKLPSTTIFIVEWYFSNPYGKLVLGGLTTWLTCHRWLPPAWQSLSCQLSRTTSQIISAPRQSAGRIAPFQPPRANIPTHLQTAGRGRGR